MSVKIFNRKFPVLYNNLKKTFFNMPTDRKIEDQDNAIEDLKGVVDCVLKSIIVAATVSGGQSQRVVKNILQQK